MVIQEPVQAAIWQCLNHYAYQDATFLAERLYAEVGSDEGLFLLATCYYRSGQPMSAYTLLHTKGCPTPACRFLMARCCLDLEKLADCETALSGSSILKPHTCDDIANDFKDSAPYALSVLGKLSSETERLSRSIEAHKLALKHNPFLWTSFQAICDLGEKIDPEKTFHFASTPTVATTPNQQDSFPILDTENMGGTGHLNTAPDVTPVPAETPQDQLITQLSGIRPLPLTTPDFNSDLSVTPDSMMTPFTVPNAPLSSRQSQARIGRLHLNSSTSSPYSPLTPSFGILPLDTPSPTPGNTTSFTGDCNLPDAKAPIRRGTTRRGPQGIKPPVFSQSGNSSNTKDLALTSLQQSPAPAGSPVQLLFPSAHGVRRSSRLFSNANSVKENTSATTKTSSNRTKTGVSKVQKGKTRARTTRSSTITKPPDTDDITKLDNQKSNELNKANSAVANLQLQIADMQKSSAEGLLRLLRDVGKAYQALSRYDLKKAVELFKSLPPQHYNTAWVLCQVGKALFEMAQYHKAEAVFSEVRRLEPHHLGYMEIYSTTLWHLQKETALSALAQDLTDLNPESPQAWCAAGNCFSLQKEHDSAIKFFQRAIQVDPKFAYAYTLLGHEYVATEELDRAMACFRNAIRISPRHYNAWYGTGMIYYKQEKFALAEMHYCKALAINPQSSVLLVHISVVQHALHKSEQALATLAKAVRLDANNPLCRFHRASILFATEKYQDALKELEEMKQMTPSESLVYFLIGKVYKKLGQTHQALANFSWALDLDPKGANSQIKEALDKHYLPEDDEPAVAALAQADTPSQGGNEDSDVVGDVSRQSLLESLLDDGEDMQLQANESDESL